MDHEAYAFAELKLLTQMNAPEMLADIDKCRGFVISAVTGDFGDDIVSLYE